MLTVLDRILTKVCCQSHKGGVKATLCQDDGETPVRVATCSPKGCSVNFGLRGSNRRHYGWSGKKDAIKVTPISDKCFLLEVENEPPLRLRFLTAFV